LRGERKGCEVWGGQEGEWKGGRVGERWCEGGGGNVACQISAVGGWVGAVGGREWVGEESLRGSE